MLTKVDVNSPDAPFEHIRLDDNHYALVDAEDYEDLNKRKWTLRRWRGCTYAVRKTEKNGRQFILPMHRQIMHCSPANVIHHINHYGLDNRKTNLIEVSKEQHHEIHRFW